MHSNGTAARARHQAGPVSPVISGENGWLGDNGRDQPLTLQLSLPVSAEELVTALYGDDHLPAADLATGENVWAFAAVAIVQDGLTAIQRRADQILVAEARGRLVNLAWPELCHRRVAEVTGSGATGPAALFPSAASTVARAGAQPPSTSTKFPRPRAPEEDAPPAEPGARPGGMAQVRALTETTAPCRAGN
jgi:hypothetical protein